MGTQSIISALKGLSYRDSRSISAARLLDVGDVVILELDPTNEYDEFAIKVLTRPGVFIGYIDRKFTKMLSMKFGYISAEVNAVKHSEIPFIDIRISINEAPISQPSIVNNPKEMSPNERMMILENIVKSSNSIYGAIPNGYQQYGFKISWIEELPRENVLRAKLCQIGEPLKLVVQIPSRYPGRIEVYTSDDVLIGFIDEETNNGLAEHIKSIIGASIHRFDGLDQAFGILYIPLDIPLVEPIGDFLDYPFKEVGEAAYIAKEDPILALDMIQYAVDHEKSLYAKELALKCYWHLKDWENRKKIALRMLDAIESLSSDEVSAFTFQYLKKRKREELIKIIDTCNKKLQPKKKK